MVVEKETDIQKAICDYLQLKGYFFWRNNNTPIYNAELKRYRAMPKYAMAGVPDIIVVLEGGRIVFLEVKKKGGRLSEGQQIFQERCAKLNTPYFVVFSIDDIIKVGL